MSLYKESALVGTFSVIIKSREDWSYFSSILFAFFMVSLTSHHKESKDTFGTNEVGCWGQ